MAVKVRIEHLVSSAITGHPPDEETSRWLTNLDDVIYSRRVAVDLVQPRAAHPEQLGPFIDAFSDRHPDLKEHTVLNLKQVRKWLVKFFGEKKDMRTIKPADAEDWRASMQKGGLGEYTIRRHVGRARQLWKAAIRRGAVRGANPFEGMVATVRADKTRQVFVDRETIQKVIDACPDAEWRLLVALSR